MITDFNVGKQLPSDPRFQDLTGDVFGRLTVVRYAGRMKSGKHMWHCRCDCGGTKTAQGGNLRGEITKSCGCLHKEITGNSRRTHGGSQKRWYQTYQRMISRCLCPKDKSYPRYGGRGISVCDRWLSDPANFLEDMGEPEKGMSIDRINNNLTGKEAYSPGNCRWATVEEQSINRRRVFLDVETVKEIRSRYANGERLSVIHKEIGTKATLDAVRDAAYGRSWKFVS